MKTPEMITDFKLELMDLLGRERTRRKITQQEFADLLEINFPQVNQIVGKTKATNSFRVDYLLDLLLKVNNSYSTLVLDTKEPRSSTPNQRFFHGIKSADDLKYQLADYICEMIDIHYTTKSEFARAMNIGPSRISAIYNNQLEQMTANYMLSIIAYGKFALKIKLVGA